MDEIKVKWTNENKKIFINSLIDEKKNGNYTDTGFNKASWDKILNEFNSKAGLAYTKQHLQSKFGEFKKKYRIFKDMLESGDFEYDSQNEILSADPDVWEKYLEANPKAREFQTKPLSFYEELDSLFQNSKLVDISVLSASFSSNHGILNTEDSDSSEATANFTSRKRALDDDAENLMSDDNGANSSRLSVNPLTPSISAIKKRRPMSSSSSAVAQNLPASTTDKILEGVLRIIFRDEFIVDKEIKKLEEIFKVFDQDFSKDFSLEERVKFKSYFAKFPTAINVFQLASREEKALYIEKIISGDF